MNRREILGWIVALPFVGWCWEAVVPHCKKLVGGRSQKQYLYVQSDIGQDTPGYGDSPERPTATLDHALTLCEDGGDACVYVLPGHRETIQGKSAVNADLSKSGKLAVIGLGESGNRPVFEFQDE